MENPKSPSEADDLSRLKRQVDLLERALRGRHSNAMLTDIMEMENGHTQWSRIRVMPMVQVAEPGDLNVPGFSDTVTELIRWTVPVPTDWVQGTDMTVNSWLYQTGTAGSPVCVLQSYLGSWKLTENPTTANIDNAASANTTLTQNELTLVSRTILGSQAEANDQIEWVLERVGGDVADTVNASVQVKFGAWLSYIAFM